MYARLIDVAFWVIPFFPPLWWVPLPSSWRWYRRAKGGHWEFWYIDVPVVTEMWLPRPACFFTMGEYPGLGRGTPLCEDWPT